jgi:autotransporter-associated beta strand protein
MTCSPWALRWFCLLTLLLGWGLRPGLAHAAAKPNIIVILSDDGGYNEYGFNAAVSAQNGGPTPTQAYTPNLDALAAQSVIARQAYAQPLCSESRAALLTGISNQRLGLEENLDNNVNDPFGFAAGQKLLPSYLKDLGYTTGMIGKWHEGYTTGVNRPTDMGFDEFFGFLSGQRNYYSDFFPGDVMLRGNTNVESTWRSTDPNVCQCSPSDISKYDPVNGRFTTDAFGEESVKFINNHAQDVDAHGDPKPFFLYTAFNSPHTPYDIKTSDYNQPQIAAINDPTYPNKRKLESLLYGMDRNVGEITAALTANGIDNNTIIVFMNDNGGLGFFQNGISSGDDNTPLQGFKGLAYEGGIRVPFLIRAPGLQSGVYNSPIIEQDLVPTLISAAGGDPSQITTDGVDLNPYLSGANTNAPHQEEFWRNRGIWAVRKGDLKLTRPDGANVYGFYDLAVDQSEQHNMISALTGPTALKIAELFRDLTAWEATLVKPKYGVLGANDRNQFDHFVFRNNLAATTNFSASSSWTESGNSSHIVTMRVDDAYANGVVEFTTRDDASYTANNDMARMSGLIYMLNQVQLTGAFGGGAAQSGTVNGNGLLLVKNLSGQAPRIQLDATTSGAASFTFNLNNELQLYNDLTIAGNGTQNFVIGGVIRDYSDFRDPTNSTPHNVTKSGTSNVTLTANNTFKGNFTINGGQVHVNGASAAISAAAKIVIGNAGALVLDNGSITVPLIDNQLHGDYNHDQQVNAADYTVWRDTFGQGGPSLAADGNGDGTVNQADYDLWNSGFGATMGGALLVNGGTLKVPTITGSVTNLGGTLASGAAPGVRTIGGSLAENLGVLQVLVGGIVPVTNFDQIQIAGTASLGGTLSVQLINGFSPLLGQTFQFLTSTGGVSGTFASLNLPSLGAGKAWQLLYGSNDLKLTVVAAGSAASVMSSGYNPNGGHAATGTVPEPSTLTLLVLAAVGCGLAAARRRHM